jgi:hypothetical protein
MRAVALVVLAACGDNTAGGLTLGSRLVPYGEAFEDGTTLVDPNPFRDLARGEDCTLEQWADTGTYCTPPWVELEFSDNACRHGIARVASGAPRYARVPFTTSNGALTSRLRALGGVVPNAPYWQAVLGDCVGPNTDDTSTFFAVDDTELSEADFVRIDRDVTPIDDRLSLVRLTTSDGLAIPIGFHDDVNGLDCAGRTTGDSSGECAPSNVAPSNGVYADAECSTPATSSKYVGVAEAVEAVVEGCPRDFTMTQDRYYGPSYQFASEQCAVVPGGGGLIAAGALLDLPRVDREIASPGSRFSTIAFGPPLLGVRGPYIHDAALGIDCKIVDGVCRPDVVAPSFVYADPACTTAILAVEISACAPASYAVMGEQLFTLGPVVTAYVMDMRGCVLIPAGTTAHTVGDPVSNDVFGKVTRVLLH